MILNNKQQGLSLVELMVAMALGLLITAAVVQLFLTNRQTFNLQQGTASVLEQGQFAVDFLTKEMMGAGYGNVGAPFTFAGNSDGDQFDVLEINLASGLDCAGGDLGVGASWKRYSVDADGVLVCSDSDLNNNQLIDNVEAFQVLYGVSASQTDTTANWYAPASQLAPGANIVSVRFAIMIASEGRTNSSSEAVGQHASDAVSIQVLDKNYPYKNGIISFEDGRLRRLFTSTVALRNVAGG